MKVHWEDPPPFERGKHTGYTMAFIEELKRHPGKWAKYVTEAGGEWVGSGTHANLKRRGCEVRVSTIGRPVERNAAVRVWARWPDGDQ